MGETVWLASYPKSGNTWFRSVYTAWRRQGDLDINALENDRIASSRWRIDALGISSDLLTADEIDRIRPLADLEVDRQSNGPHLCKTHDAYLTDSEGSAVISTEATRCAIYIVRDPRDVAVSFASHEGLTHERTVDRMSDPDASLSHSIRSLGHQVRQRLGTWSQHVKSWLDNTPFPVHLLRYEDCLAAPVEHFTEALRAAGFEATTDQVAAAVEAARFERLQTLESEQGFRERPRRSTPFFRRGIAGAWTDELDPSLSNQICTDHHDAMVRLGYQPTVVPMSDSPTTATATDGTPR